MMTESLILVSSIFLGVAVALAARWIGPVVDAVTSRQVDDLLPRFRALGLQEAKMATLLRWWVIAMIAAVVVLGVMFNIWPVAVVTVALIFITPRIVLAGLIKRRSSLLRDQLVGATVAFANASRAGLTLAQAIENVAKESPDPLASELQRIADDFHRGLPLDEAIQKAKRRLDLDSFTLFASSVLVCLDRGGRITEALERISRSLSENQRLERKLESETQSGRKVIRILAIFPIAFLGLFLVIFPQGATLLFTTLIGQLVLSGIIIIVLCGIQWSRRIMSIEF